ncbi:MAG: rhomboid family intramembrane serine protease [Myxococcota bacterium]
MTSIVLVLALIVIHVAVVGLGGHLEKGLEEGGLSGLEGALILGANVGPWVRSGEVWRWVTSTLLHTGWLHLGLNLYALVLLAPYVERILGSAQLVCLFVGCGALGSAFSTLWTQAPSVGASGALFGLLSAAWVGWMRSRGETSAAVVWVGLCPWFTLNVVAVWMPGLPMDHAAHAGGLVAGLVGGWILPLQGEPHAVWRWVVLRVGLGVACLVLSVSLVAGVRQVWVCGRDGATFYQCHPPEVLGLPGS